MKRAFKISYTISRNLFRGIFRNLVMKNAPLNLPAGYFGIVLGIIGLGFSWRFAATFWPVTLWSADRQNVFPAATGKTAGSQLNGRASAGYAADALRFKAAGTAQCCDHRVQNPSRA